ncbi:alpha/beta hydrolase [Congregibacter sp.]|uniref:alpha/beta hydrolase n=1 Tax=Congregibacter sp. TaxID=2744308 RepID=UPI003F6CC665
MTTRHVEMTDDGELRYTTQVADVSGGRCQVSLHGQQELEAVNGPLSTLSKDEVLASLAETVGDDVLIYVHGYNTGIERACREAAKLAYRTGFKDRILLVSWPASRLGVTYLQDAQRLAESMPAILDILDDLGAKFGYEKVSIVAHSMGSRLVLGEIRAQGPTQRFKNLILVAADVDTDVFVEALPQLRQWVTNIALLVSESDRLLFLSQTLNLGERLGQAHGFQATGVDVVDVSEFEDLGFSGHLYHLESDRVAEVLKRILSN